MNANDILYETIQEVPKQGVWDFLFPVTLIELTVTWHNGQYFTTQVIMVDQFGNKEIIEYALPESSGS